MAQPAALRTRYPLGCRVVLERAPSREGTVVGYAHAGERLWIRLDGRSPTTRTCYHVSCVRRLLPDDPLDDEIWYAPQTNPYRAEEP